MTRHDLALINRLAEAAGGVIRPYFRAPHGLENKSDASPVTLADREAEAAMRRIIEAECPADGIIGEEYGEKPGRSGRTWVLDPIDGTRSFIAGRAIFGTLIALCEDGWPVLGAIDQPVLGERWVGVTGQGTTMNGVRVTTRACASVAEALLAATSHRQFDAGQIARFERLEYVSANLVLGGDCYSYAGLASGHIDIVCEAGMKVHDFAALVPVVEGAGGRMCDWAGEPLTLDSDAGEILAAGDPARIEQILDILNG